MGQRPAILVVDDDPSMLTLIRAVLEHNGMNVIACSNPQQAAPLAMERPPDAIVLDLMMPGLPGLQVLELLRKEPETNQVPVLILSAKDHGADRVRGLKAGAEDYMTKPFEPEELSIRLRRLIDRSCNDSSTVFSGKLGQLAAGDILQQVLASGVTGVLELGGTPAGSITVANGAIVSARCGELRGEPALIVLLERRKGSFRLVEHPETIPSGAEPLSLNGALMLLAWLEDELERRRHLLPPSGALLQAEGGGQPPESECGLLGAAFDWFREHGEASLEQLEEAMILAPQQARLATALLVEAGLLHLRDQSAPEPSLAHEDTGAPSRRRLNAACAHLALRAKAMGRAANVLHVLVGVDPGRWEPFLDELIAGISSSLLGRPRDQLLAELRRDGSASLRIPCSEGTLLLHVHELKGLAGLRARAILAMTTAVVLVPSSVQGTGTVEIIKATASLRPSPVALVIPPPDGFWARPQLFSTWRVPETIPPSLEELLELLG